MTSQPAESSPEALLAEIAALRQEIAILRRENADLELLMEMTTEYSDDMTEDLYTTVQVTRHLLQNITDSMPSALITLDPSGQVLTWNPAAERLTGKTIDDVKGQTLWQACPELAPFRDSFGQVVSKNKVMHLHREQLEIDKETITYDVSIYPLANELKGAVLRFDDVTERIQLEEMMLQTAKMASLGGMATGIAHEINNPLSGMIQSAQVLQLAFDTHRLRTRERLQDYGVDPDRLERYLQELNLPEYLAGIRTTGERAANIVADLLSFARKSPLKTSEHDLHELVKQALALASTDYDLRRMFDFRDLNIHCEFATELPQINCDGQHIEQVILNLVHNAAQAMAKEREKQPDQPGQLTIRTLLSPEPAYIRLEIEDNGPGIPKELQSRLFEPFFTTKPTGEGTGLGLWICWSIVVERHKGKIWVESGAEGGAKFVIELPITEE